ncbi:MAG: LytTR family DNA-binding domain-containing protein [Bacteroidota bacterium]|nr:LytTR family DNA-binding domain-containing protein [Bacteroidota bacterium]
MIRCVIVDDEPLAVSLLKDHIEQVPDLQLLLGTNDPLKAVEYIRNFTVDLIFLDIQMPKLNGVEIMRIISPNCLIVVTSAYSQYAIHGFEHNVVDYLLKPITLSRFLVAISKVKDKLNIKTNHLKNFAYLKVEQRMQRVNFDDILYVEGLKDYVLLHLVHGKITALQTMKGMEELLPGDSFVRLHKSYILSTRKIEQIHKQHVVVNNTIIPIGEFYKDSFLKLVLNG